MAYSQDFPAGESGKHFQQYLTVIEHIEDASGPMPQRWSSRLSALGTLHFERGAWQQAAAEFSRARGRAG